MSVLFDPSPKTTTPIDGAEVVAPTFLHASEQARLKGYRVVCAPGEVTIFDIEVTSQLLVQGGQFWLRNAADEDYADFSIVDKNDVLGLHTQYGIPLGTPIELRKYVDYFPFPPGDYQDNIVMPTVAPIIEGLFMRVVYHSHGVAPVTLGMLYRWYENTGA